MTTLFLAMLTPLILLPLIPVLARWLSQLDLGPSRRDLLRLRLEQFRREGQRGMSLVEVMVAVVIIMIGLLALMAVIPFAASNVQSGSTISTATFLANAKIDQVKNASYTGTYDSAGNCLGIATDLVTPIAGTETVLVDYTRTTSVSSVAATGVCPMKQVTVQVQYRNLPALSVSMQVSPR